MPTGRVMAGSTGEPPALIERVRVLEAPACAAIHAQVEALRPQWFQRGRESFHTLGAALYLDAPLPETTAHFQQPQPPPLQYETRQRALNPRLLAHFDALYAALSQALSALLNADVRYAPGRALPGFHIFDADPCHAQEHTHVPHFDRQYECATWHAAAPIDFSNALSFTLPISLPQAGGGLRVWPVSLQEVLAREPEAARALVAAAAMERHAYALGELVCHRGHLLHRIAAWPALPGEQRVTLQGHALYFDNAWQLYW